MLPQDLDLASNTEVISTASVCDYCEWHEITQNIDGSKLSLLTINVRSLPGKYAELCACLSRVEKKFTFFIIKRRPGLKQYAACLSSLFILI